MAIFVFISCVVMVVLVAALYDAAKDGKSSRKVKDRA
jgi:hypothetical protein